MLATIGLAAVLGTAARIETAFVRIPHSTEQVAIHCMKPQHARDTGVLFVHGSTFPTRLASGYEFGAGDSWLSFVAARGYLACGLDFAGYGASSRPAAMLETANHGPPVLPVAARHRTARTGRQSACGPPSSRDATGTKWTRASVQGPRRLRAATRPPTAALCSCGAAPRALASSIFSLRWSRAIRLPAHALNGDVLGCKHFLLKCKHRGSCCIDRLHESE
jgi:hypothetical protein